MTHYIKYLLFATLLSFTACADDPIFNAGSGDDFDGECDVTLNFSFDDPTPTPLGSRSSGQPGNLIKSIDDLNVVFFTPEGELERMLYFTASEFTVSTDEKRTDAEGNPLPDSPTSHVEIAGIRIKSGKYRVYAVANVGDLRPRFKSDPANAGEFSDEASFKAVRFKWDSDNIGKNSQMAGYFTNDSFLYDSTDAPVVVLNRQQISLHAWIKRLASKVTIAYDGTKLNENVQIYILSAQIRDLAPECALINPNRPGRAKGNNPLRFGYDKALDGSDLALIPKGDHIDYVDMTNVKFDDIESAKETITADIYEKSKIRITTGTPLHGNHSADAPALYFYENDQDEGEYKSQVKPGASDPSQPTYPLDKFPEWRKDKMPWGTYIEVKGYYINKSFDNFSYGPIIYRFMLGKDTERNYDAERNHHFRLTLKFKNDANNPDWHVDYDNVPDPPEISVIPKIYISYLYHNELDIPVKFHHDAFTKVSNVKVDILENNWGYPTHKYYSQFNPAVGSSTFGRTGFLSLAKVSGLTETDTQLTSTKTYTPKLDSSKTSSTLSLPLFTRSLNVTATGEDNVKREQFSGNNPFVGYERKAKIRITATFRTTTVPVTTVTREAFVEVVQVKRIVNPKGIWRSWNKDHSFHVILKEGDPYLNHEERNQESSASALTYSDLSSDGPWRARIVTGKDWVRIGVDDSNYGTDEIVGRTGSVVQFWYKPADKLTSATAAPRFGIIEVEYHGDSKCKHQIMVSQGMGNTTINGQKWKMANLKYAGVEEENPLLEGSMFKYGTSTVAIRSINNEDDSYGFNKAAINKTFKCYDASGQEIDRTFMEIGTDLKGFTNAAMTKNNGNVPTMAQLEKLFDTTANLTRYYGILYGDECTEPGDTKDKASGYLRVGDVKGMRGMFIIDNSNNNQIFFPIGSRGHGRRMFVNNSFASTCQPFTIRQGVLKYGARGGEMLETDVKKYVRPIFYNIWKEFGAIYYAQKLRYNKSSTDKGYDAHNPDYMGLDINYFSFGLNLYNDDRIYKINQELGSDGSTKITNNTGRVQSDAAFIRRIATN